jgi:group I intron endonuclease
MLTGEYMFIYCVINTINENKYVGQTNRTLNKRMNEHYSLAFNRYSKSPFHRALRKYGRQSFIWIIIEECESQDDLNIKEVEWSEKLNSIAKRNGHGYNLRVGGQGGMLSDAQKKHIGIKNKNRAFHQKGWYKKKLSNKLKGEKNPRYIHLNNETLMKLYDDFKSCKLTNKELELKYKMSRPAIYRHIDKLDPSLRNKINGKRYKQIFITHPKRWNHSISLTT